MKWKIYAVTKRREKTYQSTQGNIINGRTTQPDFTSLEDSSAFMVIVSKKTVEHRLFKNSSNKFWWPQIRPQTTWHFQYWWRSWGHLPYGL